MKRYFLNATLLLSIFAVTGLTAAAQFPTGNIQRFALIIGIKGYPNFPAKEKLNFADKDAEAFRDFILTPAGGNFPESHVRLLTNERATRTGIYEQIDWLSKITKPYDNSLVYVFFAGHGIADDEGRAFLMPFEARKDAALSSGGIRAHQFRKDLEESVNARHLVFFIDACYAGAVAADGTARGNRNVSSEFVQTWNRSINSIQGIQMGLFSASSNQLSTEDPTLERGLFTHFLITGLKGKADLNPKDGRVTAGEVYGYVLGEVDNRAKARFSRRQTPIVSPRFDPELTLSIIPSIRALKPELMYLKLFEQGPGATPPQSQRQYAESFNSDNTRYIGWELAIRVPAAGADVGFRIDATWTWPDGAIYKSSHDKVVPDSWRSASYTGAPYGYKEVGKWPPGMYKLDLFLDGTKFVSKAFTVGRSGVLTFESLNPKVAFVKFFEKGTGDIPPRAQRTHANAFSAPKTRYVAWEIEIDMSSRPVDFEFQIDTVWYGPDGSIFGRESKPSSVKKEWTGVNQASLGFGWENPGNWKPGTYRVDFFVNQNKIASETFQIFRLAYETVNPTVTAVKFFEKGTGPVPPKAERTYGTTFWGSRARYISWEINITMSSRPLDFEFKIDTVWYGPDGSIFGRESELTPVKKEWTGVNQASSGFGWANPGNWKPGTYRVDFFVNQQKIGSNTFEIR